MRLGQRSRLVQFRQDLRLHVLTGGTITKLVSQVAESI